MHNKISSQFYYTEVFPQTLEKGEVGVGGEERRGGDERKVQLFSLAVSRGQSADMKVSPSVELGAPLKALFLALYILEIQTVNNQD